jgi:hypothetical protein
LLDSLLQEIAFNALKKDNESEKWWRCRADCNAVREIQLKQVVGTLSEREL